MDTKYFLCDYAKCEVTATIEATSDEQAIGASLRELHKLKPTLPTGAHFRLYRWQPGKPSTYLMGFTKGEAEN